MGSFGVRAVVRFDVLVQDADEVGDDGIALEGNEEAAVGVDRGFGFFEGAGERDADVGVFGLSGAVDDAAHDGDAQFFDAAMTVFPDGHLLADVALNLFGHLLKKGAGSAAASGAGGDLRGEASDVERLQDLLRHQDFLRAVAVGGGRERDTDGVADSFLQQNRHRGSAGDNALGSHAGLGKTEVQRIVAAGGEGAVDVNQALRAGDLGAQNDPVVRQSVFLGHLGGAQRALDDRLLGDFLGFERLGAAGVLVHHPSQQSLVQGSPVDADAHGLVVLDGNTNHGAEIVVVLLADVDIAGIDAVLGEKPGAVGKLGQQQMAVVVEIADDGNGNALRFESPEDIGQGGGGGFRVDRDTDELRSRASERRNLPDGRGGVRRVRVGHGLNDDRMRSADQHASDGGGYGLSAVDSSHTKIPIMDPILLCWVCFVKNCNLFTFK